MNRNTGLVVLGVCASIALIVALLSLREQWVRCEAQQEQGRPVDLEDWFSETHPETQQDRNMRLSAVRGRGW